MIEEIKVLLEIYDNESDKILNLLCRTASDEFMLLTGCSADDYPRLIQQMVVERFNKLGSEGINSLSFGSANENCADNYSAGLQKAIRRCKKVKVF